MHKLLCCSPHQGRWREGGREGEGRKNSAVNSCEIPSPQMTRFRLPDFVGKPKSVFT